ncbi:MAG: MGMT family protein [archaeon GB-1867-035]|nr:MGMT family protein [Candidatus Culexmicrobium profundum]
MKTRISWKEKLKKEARIVDIPPRMTKRFGTGKMLIPSPLDIDVLIRKVKKGKLVTQGQIRRKLAKKYGVKVTCPLTTGIFLRIIAEAAEEDLRKSERQVTPYWRVIKDDGSLNPKFPGGVELQAKRLREEGHIILEGRWKKPPRVKDFEKYLQEL